MENHKPAADPYQYPAKEPIAKRLTKRLGIVWPWIVADTKKISVERIKHFVEILGIIIAAIVVRIYWGQLDEMTRQTNLLNEQATRSTIQDIGGTALTNRQLSSIEKQNHNLSQLVAQVKSGVNLQKGMVGLSVEGPVVELTPGWLGVFPRNNKTRLLYQIAVHMAGGKTGAVAIEIASTMQVRDYPPTDYNVGPFKRLKEPARLPPYNPTLHPWFNQLAIYGIHDPVVEPVMFTDYLIMPKPVKFTDAMKTAYIWGQIRYRNELTDSSILPGTFCRRIMVSKVLDPHVSEAGISDDGICE